MFQLQGIIHSSFLHYNLQVKEMCSNWFSFDQRVAFKSFWRSIHLDPSAEFNKPKQMYWFDRSNPDKVEVHRGTVSPRTGRVYAHQPIVSIKPSNASTKPLHFGSVLFGWNANVVALNQVSEKPHLSHETPNWIPVKLMKFLHGNAGTDFDPTTNCINNIGLYTFDHNSCVYWDQDYIL